MRNAVVSLALAAMAFSPQAAPGQENSCEFTYVIQQGDTLARIAEIAFGTKNYQLIYARNPQLSASIGDLPAGEEIVIPCLPGAGGLVPDEEALRAAMAAGDPPAEVIESAPEAVVADEEATSEAAAESTAENATDDVGDDEAAETDATAEAAASEAETAAEPAAEDAAETEVAAVEPEEPAAPAADQRPVRFLTATGQRPFADLDLRNGGMVTELVRKAMDGMTPSASYKIIFVNDRDSHLQDLLIDGSFDIGFPWLRPRCDEIERLRDVSAKDAWLCENFAFSEPFYEFVNGFFVRKGDYSTSRASWTDFAEGRICRPEGGPLTDLFVKGLNDEETEFVRPKTVRECVELLALGEVDAMSAEVFEAEETINALDLRDKIEELPQLSLLWTVHAIAPNAKAEATSRIEMLDEELIDLKISGEWFRIVARHLAQN